MSTAGPPTMSTNPTDMVIPSWSFDSEKVFYEDNDELQRVRECMASRNVYVTFFHRTKATITVPNHPTASEESKFCWYWTTIQDGDTQDAATPPYAAPVVFTPPATTGLFTSTPPSVPTRIHREDRGESSHQRAPQRERYVGSHELNIDGRGVRRRDNERERYVGSERHSEHRFQHTEGGRRHQYRSKSREQERRGRERGHGGKGKRRRSYSSSSSRSRSPSPHCASGSRSLHRGVCRAPRATANAPTGGRSEVALAADRPYLRMDMRTRKPLVSEWYIVQKRISSECKRFYPSWHLWEDIIKDEERLLDCQNAIRGAFENGNLISDRFLEKRMVKTLKQRRYYDKEKVRKCFDYESNRYVQPQGMSEALFKGIVADLSSAADTPAYKRQHRGDAGTRSAKRQVLTNSWGQGGYPRFHSNFVARWGRQPSEAEETYARKYSARELNKKLVARKQGLDYKCEKELAAETNAIRQGPTETHTVPSSVGTMDRRVSQELDMQPSNPTQDIHSEVHCNVSHPEAGTVVEPENEGLSGHQSLPSSPRDKNTGFEEIPVEKRASSEFCVEGDSRKGKATSSQREALKALVSRSVREKTRENTDSVRERKSKKTHKKHH